MTDLVVEMAKDGGSFGVAVVLLGVGVFALWKYIGKPFSDSQKETAATFAEAAEANKAASSSAQVAAESAREAATINERTTTMLHETADLLRGIIADRANP